MILSIASIKSCSELNGFAFHLKVVAKTSLNYSEITLQNKLPVYGTLMDGENIFTAELSQSGFIVLE